MVNKKRMGSEIYYLHCGILMAGIEILHQSLFENCIVYLNCRRKIWCGTKIWVFCLPGIIPIKNRPWKDIGNHYQVEE